MLPYICFFLNCVNWVTCFYGDFGKYVTYASGVKLLNEQHQVKLFSGSGYHYGGGSNQQSVTAQSSPDDSNALWIVERANGVTRRGEVVRCHDVVKLRHVKTGKTLHSVHVGSPLSNQHLVMVQTDLNSLETGDHWIVECTGWRDVLWDRTCQVKLRHLDTSAYLSLSGEYYQYPMSMNGHMEVVASFQAQYDLWTPDEGVFFKKPVFHSAGTVHSEL